MALALHQLVQYHFMMDISEVSLIRLGRGIRSYGHLKTSSRSCTIYWSENNSEDIQVFDADSAQVNMKEIALDWKTTYSVQLCRQDSDGPSFGEAAAEVSAPTEMTDDRPEQPRQDGQLPTQILADSRAPPGSRGVPHY